MDAIFGSPARMIIIGVLLLLVYVVSTTLLDLHDETVAHISAGQADPNDANLDSHGSEESFFDIPQILGSSALHVLLEILRDFAIAVIIAAVIIFAIEIKGDQERTEKIASLAARADQKINDLADTAEKLTKRVSEQSVDSVLRSQLPDGWFKYIQAELQRAKFVRRRLRLQVLVREPTEQEKAAGCDDGHFLLEQTVAYDLGNMTEENQTFSVRAFAEFPFRSDLRDFVKVLGVEIDGVSLSDEALRKGDEMWDDTETHHTFCHQVDVAAGGKLHVVTRVQNIRPRTDRFVWVASDPAEGIEVEYRVPNESVGFLSVLHSDYISGSMTRKAFSGSTLTARTEKPVLPGLAVEIAWAPISQGETATIPPSADSNSPVETSG